MRPADDEMPSRKRTIYRVVIATGSVCVSVVDFLTDRPLGGAVFAALAASMLALSIVRPQIRPSRLNTGQSAMRTRTICLMAALDVLSAGVTILGIVQIIRGQRVGGAVVLVVIGLAGLLYAARGTARAVAFEPRDRQT